MANYTGVKYNAEQFKKIKDFNLTDLQPQNTNP